MPALGIMATTPEGAATGAGGNVKASLFTRSVWASRKSYTQENVMRGA